MIKEREMEPLTFATNSQPSIDASGDAVKRVASYIREINCAQDLGLRVTRYPSRVWRSTEKGLIGLPPNSSERLFVIEWEICMSEGMVYLYPKQFLPLITEFEDERQQVNELFNGRDKLMTCLTDMCSQEDCGVVVSIISDDIHRNGDGTALLERGEPHCRAEFRGRGFCEKWCKPSLFAV